MSKYINADDLCKTILKIPATEEITKGKLIDLLDTLPQPSESPVIHAKWITSEIPCEEYVCSNCGGACWYYEHTGTLGKSRYCPTCGAKMDLEE